jgi:hypothetical protein
VRRTTITLDEETEALLRAESRRTGQPMSAVIRDALRERYQRGAPASRHAGAFRSGRTDTAEDVDRALQETGYGT